MSSAVPIKHPIERPSLPDGMCRRPSSGRNPDMIDLRSDTLTKPTQAMRAAMASAEVGDDVWGEDPTIIELERRTADLLGHEAGLYCPTGTMTNLLGVWLLVERGRELLCDEEAHIIRAEVGGHADLHGITTRTWTTGHTGIPSVATIEDMLSVNSGHVDTQAVALENTHNFGGGSVLPVELLEQVSQLCADNGIRRHLDGARLWNAHVVTGVPLDRYGKLFDTISICYSKGLGAPVGSVLVSDAERIAKARKHRRAMGGSWRQGGMLAAAALYALDNHLDRLTDDHAAAAAMAAEILQRAPQALPNPPQTNIVVLRTGNRTGAEVAELAQERGVLVSVVGTRVVRAVSHLGISGEDCVEAGRIMGELLAG